MMKLLSSIMLTSVLFLGACSSSSNSEEKTEIVKMDSSSTEVKKQVDKLDDQTKKVEESLEKLDKEFQTNN